MRVPLNTALLAVQNMQASGIITQDIEFKALEGSLSMMSKGRLIPLGRSFRKLTVSDISL